MSAKKPKPAPKKKGRKPIKLDMKVVKRLKDAGFNMADIAKSMRVGQDTLRKYPGFKKAYGTEDRHTNGRPKIVIDLVTVEKLGKIQCTQIEIASILGVHHDTMRRFSGFREAYKKGKDAGKFSLRRKQFATALGGSITMQIWLGKQYLSQSDKIEHSELENPADILDEFNEKNPMPSVDDRDLPYDYPEPGKDE